MPQILIKYGETLDYQCQRQQWQHKMSGRKINFCSKFAIKTFCAANADTESLKSLSTLFDAYLDVPHAGEI